MEIKLAKDYNFTSPRMSLKALINFYEFLIKQKIVKEDGAAADRLRVLRFRYGK